MFLPKGRKGWKHHVEIQWPCRLSIDHFWSNPTCIKHQIYGSSWKKQQIAGKLGASTKKCHVSQRWGKQPAPWHCWCTPVDSSTRPDFVHQGPHWIEAFDLSKVEGLTKRTHVAILKGMNRKMRRKRKEKSKISMFVPFFGGFFGWISCFRIDFCRMVSQWNKDQLSHHPKAGYATRVRSSQCRLLYMFPHKPPASWEKTMEISSFRGENRSQ